MKYVSTRGRSAAATFTQVLTSGLAPDGGLYMPESFPHFSLDEIKSWKTKSYQDLVETIISPYMDNAIPKADLRNIINIAYSQFRHAETAPVSKLGDNLYMLELFHGPTLAFKDFALQLLGGMLDYVLARNNQSVTIIGATSGDTGSAAIYGCMHSKHVKIFMLHPQEKVSDVQRKQMTTIDAENVFNIAVKGTFDDCQDAVKALFQDKEFSAGKNLVAVNSINWARIMAQIVYYFSAYLKLGAPESISFSVPTGNFGDVFAGYVASKMGLPVKKLIVATNTNDILHRFFQQNDYSKSSVTPTISPSMDIQVSSNFERLLFDLHGNDGRKVAELMGIFKKTGKLSVSKELLDKAKQIFASYRADEKDTLVCIKNVYEKNKVIIDPHTAVGVHAANNTDKGTENAPMVVLSTAHPAKFPDAIKKAGVPEAEQPDFLQKMMDRKEHLEVIDNKLENIKSYINNNL